MRTPLVALAALLALPAVAAEPAAPTASPAFRALAARDGVDCAALPVADAAELAALTDPALSPPWVPMRAAHCLVQRYGAAAEPLLTPWFSDPGRAGLVLVVVDALDAVPADVAARIATAALDAADADGRSRIVRRIRDSVHPGVSALAAPR